MITRRRSFLAAAAALALLPLARAPRAALFEVTYSEDELRSLLSAAANAALREAATKRHGSSTPQTEMHVANYYHRGTLLPAFMSEPKLATRTVWPHLPPHEPP